MFGSSNNNETKIKRKTKIKQKHKLHDPTLLNQPIIATGVGQTGLTGTKSRSSSSSSSSSSNQEVQQKPGLGTTMVEGLTGQTQMGQGSMGPGLSNQGFTQGSQNYPSQFPNQYSTQFPNQQYPNTGITGTGLSTNMPVNQQGELPSTKTMAKNEAKVTLVQKVKEKLLHHGDKS